MRVKDPLGESECDHSCKRVQPCSGVNVSGSSPQPYRGKITQGSDSPRMKI